MTASNEKNLNNEFLKYSNLKICRLCESDKHLTELFTADRNILRKTKALIDCSITGNDELPKYICLQCTDAVQSYYNFKIQCEFTDYKLRKRIAEQQTNTTTTTTLNDETICYDVDDCLNVDIQQENDKEKKEITIEFHLNNLRQDEAFSEVSETNAFQLLKNVECEHLFTGSESVIEEIIYNDVAVQHDIYETIVYEEPGGDRNESSVQDDIINERMTVMNGKTTDDEQLEEEYLDDVDFDDESCCEDFDNSSQVIENQPNDLYSLLLNECEQDSNNLGLLQPVESIEIIIEKNNSEMAPKSSDNTKIQKIPHKSTNKFVCDTCGLEFKKFIDYSEHNKSHGKQRYQCDVCGKWFLKRYHLRNHKNIHDQNYKRFACDLCTKSYSSQGNLDRHKRVYHQKHKAYFCDICGRGFSQSTILRTHLNVHLSENKWKYKCPVCQKLYKSESYLKRHKMRHFCAITSSNQSIGINSRNNNNNNKTTQNVQNPAMTKRKAKIKKIYVCTECGKKSNSVALHLGHMRTHTGEQPFECDVCNKRFSFGQSLKAHKLLHTGAKPYKCTVCDVTFRQIGHLLGHKLVHTGEKRHKCLICGKSFALRGNLNVHMRLHTGETPYHCNGCDKRFSDANNLKRHILIHDKR